MSGLNVPVDVHEPIAEPGHASELAPEVGGDNAFQSDKQNMVQHYLGILSDAADAKIMVNFHGCTVPRGWQRTWPHLMSMEGVRGAECYIFDKQFPAEAPRHNTMLAFSRPNTSAVSRTVGGTVAIQSSP